MFSRFEFFYRLTINLTYQDTVIEKTIRFSENIAVFLSEAYQFCYHVLSRMWIVLILGIIPYDQSVTLKLS